MRNKKGQFVKGRHITEKERKRLGLLWKGKEKSEEHRRKLSESKMGAKNPMFGKHLSVETRKKMSNVRRGRIPWNKGKKCPQLVTNWQGGISSENEIVRHSMEYRLWREAVFARDNWTCQKTNVKGCKLHAHHIQNFNQYPELRFAIDNGITLSEKAHREFHKKYGQQNNTKEQIAKWEVDHK